MFKEEYQAAFSKVTASRETHRRVMNMANRKHKSTGRRIAALAAAVIALMAVTVTAFAAEEITGWFRSHFARSSGKELSAEQIEYIERNEQVLGESQTQNDWTVELRSAMNDGTTASIILGITAPEGVDLEPERDDQGGLLETFTPGNGGMAGAEEDVPEILTASKGVVWSSLSYAWEEDGDGLDNTKNYVIQIWPDMERSTVAPFGEDAEYYIHIENLVREYEDEEYRRELLNGKYKGQTDVMFTSEETARLYCAEVLAEGTWDFTVSFRTEDAQAVELLTEPVTTLASIFRKVGPEITDYVQVDEEVTLTSVVLRPLSVTFFYADCDGGPSFTAGPEHADWHVYVVMRDGSQIELHAYGASGTGYRTLEAETPIVLEEADHILMADGTMIPVPAQETE